jgi:hypothetical protein
MKKRIFYAVLLVLVLSISIIASTLIAQNSGKWHTYCAFFDNFSACNEFLSQAECIKYSSGKDNECGACEAGGCPQYKEGSSGGGGGNDFEE